MIARAESVDSVGTFDCNSESSAVISGPMRSARVLSICPSLMKVVPSSVIAMRTRAAVVTPARAWPSALRSRSFSQG